jgi:hypothetical protein
MRCVSSGKGEGAGCVEYLPATAAPLVPRPGVFCFATQEAAARYSAKPEPGTPAFGLTPQGRIAIAAAPRPESKSAANSLFVRVCTDAGSAPRRCLRTGLKGTGSLRGGYQDAVL